jgi:hypothetical protein
MKLRYDEPLSNFAVNCNLRRYIKAAGGVGRGLTALQLDIHEALRPTEEESIPDEDAVRQQTIPFHLVWSAARRDVRANVLGRGLHSSTFQLNLSRF